MYIKDITVCFHCTLYVCVKKQHNANFKGQGQFNGNVQLELFSAMYRLNKWDGKVMSLHLQ